MEEITQTVLKQMHEEKLSNGHNNEHNTLQIIQIIGGIDKVLTDYDNITQFRSTQEKLERDNKNSIQHYFHFKSSNTYLHSWFDENIHKTLQDLIHNRITQYTIIFSAIIYYILLYTMFRSVVYPIYMISINCILWIPYFSLWILSANKEACKLIVKSFEFAFKTYFLLNFVVSNFVNQYVLNYKQFGNLLYVAATANILNAVTIILLFCCVSIFDAHPVKVYWKIALSMTVAILFTLRTTSLFFLLETNEDDSIMNIPATNIQLSLYNIEMSSTRILAIFFWKQAILTLYRSKKAKNKSILIKYSPFIKWDDDEGGKNDDNFNVIYVKHNRDQLDPLQIIKTLGGIDTILTYYISNSSLSQNQINGIHPLINNDIDVDDTKDSIRKCFYLTQSNSYLSLYFGQKNQKIIKKYIVGNKIIHSVILLATIPYIALTFMPKYYYTPIYPLYCTLATCLLLIPFMCFWILSANRNAFKSVVYSFEFGYKMHCALAYVIAVFLYEFILHSKNYHNVYYMHMTANIFNAITVIVFIFGISLFDAHSHSNKYVKITFSALLAMTFTWKAFVLLFGFDNNYTADDSMIYIPLTNIQVSLARIKMNALRILSIFLWKQAIVTLYRSKTSNNTSVLIKYYPYIKWDTETERSNDTIELNNKELTMTKDAMEDDKETNDSV